MTKQIHILGLKISYGLFSSKKNKRDILLFIHGWGGTKNSWEKNILELSHSYDCIALDLPGFGESQTPAKPWGTFEYAEFLKEFIDTVGLEDPILIGKSFGARVAIAYASKWTQSVKKLVLVSAAGIEKKSIALRIQIVIAKILKFVSFIVPGVDEEYIRKLFYRSKGLKEEGKYKREVKKIVTNQDLRGLLPFIVAKTLIIWGSDDKVLPLSYAEEMRGSIKNAKLKVIEQGDHWVHQNQPDEFNKVVIEFL